MKETDIRPEELMEKKKPALEHDKKFLRDRKNLFIKVNCPVCDSKQYEFWGEKEGFEYQKCNTCGTVFMNPRASTDLLREFYKQSKNYEFWNKYIFPASDNVRREKIFKPRAKKTIEYCKKNNILGGVLIEIGSAYGTYCQAINDFNFFQKIIAIEPTPDLAQTCRDKGIETIERTVEELNLPENYADVIVCFEVIEHLGNPKLFIQNAAKYLKKEGLFIASCPNGEGLDMLVLKENARTVDHEHINYFNPDSLCLLLKNCGFEIAEVATPGLLDVDIISNIYSEKPELFEHETFIKKIISTNNFILKNNFQDFLKTNLLSSHLWIVAKKN